MRLGIQLREPLFNIGNILDDLTETVSQAARYGLQSVWLAQAFNFDALTALAVVGRSVPNIELGTAVIPTYPRHPLALAEQALTVQAACGGRLVLGIGPSHRGPVEAIYGYSFDRVVRHVGEYLQILLPALESKRVDFCGEMMAAHTEALGVQGSSVCPVVLGAMGPRMLVLAGAVAGGTVTAKTGPRTLSSHIVPVVTEAARQAGRPQPRIAACLPLCVTNDPEAAEARVDAEYAGSAELPSYRAMLEREGVTRPGSIAIVGDEGRVAAKIVTLEDTGITDYLARIVGSEEERTRSLALLGSMVR